jgi:large subunit ribosomal protein L24
MSTAKIQSGDSVRIIAGNYRGTVGRVTKVVRVTLPNGKARVRASVDAVAKIVKYRKSQTFQGQNYPGSMGQVNRLIDISNISLIDIDDKISKVKVVVDGKKKVRQYKTTSTAVKREKIVKVSKSESELTPALSTTN